MKHLKSIFESTESEKEDILENFILISDKFGEPSIQVTRFGELFKWSLVWDIKLNISVLQEANEMASKLKDLSEIVDDILAASDRLEKYNVNMGLTDRLVIELVPKETGSDTYQFIKGYKDRILYVRINEIERFFNSRGVRILDWDLDRSFDEFNKTNNLEITLSERKDMGLFYNLIMAELNEKVYQPYDRDYQVRYEGQKKIVIYPNEEKAYISCVG